MTQRHRLSDTQARVLRLIRKAGGGPLHRRDIGTGLRPVQYSTLESLRKMGFIDGMRGGEWTITARGSDVIELWFRS